MSQQKITDTYSFRSLTEDDLGEVADFECEIARISFGDDAITDLAVHKKRLAKSVGSPGAIIAESASGEIAGWALAVSRQNASTGEVYGDFRSFYIAAPHRGGRMSFLLIAEVIDYAQRNEWTRLVGRTAANNAAMQAVYRFFNFEAKHIVYELALEKPAPKTKKQPSGGDALPRRGSTAKKPFHRKKGSRRT